MGALIAVLVGVFSFGIGQSTAPKPAVTVVQDGAVVESFKAETSIMVVMEDDKVSVLKSRPSYLAPGRSTAPFRRDVYGEWTVDCQTYCEEGDGK